MKQYSNIRRILTTFSLLVCALAFSQAQAALQIHKSEESELSIFGTIQVLGLGEYVKDDIKKSGRVYLFMQQERLGFVGHIGDYRFYTELAFGGEDMTPGTANPAFTLLEMRVDVPAWTDNFIRVGQFKTPYGAEFLTPDNERNFSENSIANLGGNWGKETGLVLASTPGSFNWAAGVFTGGGEDTPSVPVHALPEDFGSPLLIARFGVDNSGADALSHSEAKVFKVEKTQKLLYFQGAYQVDSAIGHSTAVNIKANQANMVYQQNLLLNSGWNPYLTTADKATLYSLGLNGTMRAMSGDTLVTGEFQIDASNFSDNLGSLRMYTARIQASAAKKPWEYAFRVAALAPDKSMGPAGSAGLIGGSVFYELTPSISYYTREWSKIVLEVQGLVNVPVAHEPNDGSYVLSDMPSQTTYTSGGKTLPDTVTREFVPEVRLMWQFTL